MVRALRTLLFCSVLIAAGKINAQCPTAQTLNFQNPSFEGTPQPHVTPGPWTMCMSGQTPDTQPGSWGVTLPPTNGSTYLGLVHQVSASWQEGASEQLSSPFVTGVTYTFNIDLANSSATGGGIIPGCAECQIWGGFGNCDQNTLLWSSGDITPMDQWFTYTVTFTPTQAFTHVMIQVNALGCTDLPYILVDNISPIQPANVTASVALDNNVTCNGMNNGQATVHAVGQNPPFTYVWSSTPTQTDTVLNGVGPGTYTVTVTDINTCSSTATVTITEPLAITLTPTINNVTCFGFSTGSAYMSYSGGTTPFTFLWSNNVTTQPNGNLFAGMYTITATDANSCTATASISITQPPMMTITGTPTQPTCSSLGSIATSITGGSVPFTYIWNTTPQQTTATATNLSAGNYTVTVTDNNTCTGTTTLTLNAPPNIPSITLTPVDVLCFGQSTGGVNGIYTGGTPAYNYTWNTTPVQTTANATALASGNYSVTVTDANNCTSSASATVNQPAAPLSVSITPANIVCNGANTGSIAAAATGGTTAYLYNWNTVPVQTTATAVNLIAGNYTVTVTDANGCSVTAGVPVTQPAAVSVLITKVDVLCNGMNTGSATATPAGGVTPYTYNWNSVPVQTTPTASNLGAGNYSVTVSDVNNCSVTASTIITEPTLLTVTTTLTSPLCFGQPNAAASSNASGGISPYNYSWNTVPVSNTQNISNIAAGTFTVTVTDANLCTATSSIVVAAPPTPLTTTVSHVDVLCFGDATGSVTVVASGSYGNYSYNWNSFPIQTTAAAANLVAGNYSVTVTDIQGCTATASDVVSQPASALSITTSKTDVLCYGNATGDATVTATGGTNAYAYTWSTAPVQTTALISSLIAGIYNVSVTDANGCSLTSYVIINQPSQLTATSAVTNLSCFNSNDGAIIITTTGGVTAYSYVWSVTPSVNSPNASNIPAGIYEMTVTDANNCALVLNNIVVTEPSVLTLNPLVVDVSCPGFSDGSIEAVTGGGTVPYNFVWSNGANSQLNSNLTTGIYWVTVTDNNGCTISSSGTVASFPGVILSGTPTDVLCFPLKNGAVNISATTSFPPMQYLWSNGMTTQNISALDTGTYSVTITDAHNCRATDDFIVGNDAIFGITATPDSARIKLGQNVDLNISATGSSIASLIWSPSSDLSCSDCVNPNASPIQTIKYFVTAYDPNGCEAKEDVVVIVAPEYEVFIPNAFTPNGDGNNDYFEIFGNKEAWKHFEVDVFNRLGEKVFESNDMNFKWDGTFRGKPESPSVFVYMVRVVYLNNYTDKMFKGSVTLLR